MSKNKKINTNINLKKGDLINYRYLYNNKQDKNGLIVDIREDLNFGYMLKILNDENVEIIPISLILYTLI
jgi:hypothetical protein